MVRAYLDEDVSVLLAPLLQAREINASTARDHAMLGKQDEEQLQKAKTDMEKALKKHKLYKDHINQRTENDGISQKKVK